MVHPDPGYEAEVESVAQPPRDPVARSDQYAATVCALLKNRRGKGGSERLGHGGRYGVGHLEGLAGAWTAKT